jgi:hypothetical protein
MFDAILYHACTYDQIKTKYSAKEDEEKRKKRKKKSQFQPKVASSTLQTVQGTPSLSSNQIKEAVF